MSDLISRQAAIDALGERPTVWTTDDEYSLGARNQYDMDKLAIETVPSAQPEITEEQAIEHLQSTGWMQRHDRILTEYTWDIIRCKDCKYGDTFHEFDEPDMPMKCLGQHYGGTYPDDFCSYAERRTDD